jgi:hypothetical protein
VTDMISVEVRNREAVKRELARLNSAVQTRLARNATMAIARMASETRCGKSWPVACVLRFGVLHARNTARLAPHLLLSTQRTPPDEFGRLGSRSPALA